MKILILRFSRIGDCVIASALVEALRERYADAHLAWGVQSKAKNMVQGLPNLDEVIHWKDNEPRALSLSRSLCHTRRSRFDIVLDLNGANKAGYFMMASGAKRRITGSRASPLTRRSSTEMVQDAPLKSTHMRDFFFNRASPLDIAPDAAQRFFPKVPLTEAHRHFAADFLITCGLHDEHRLVGLNLGASNAEKRWPPERFAQLATQLLRDDDKTRIILFGAPTDKPLAELFEAEMERLHQIEYSIGSQGVGTSRDTWRSRVWSGVERVNLLQLAALAEHCAAFVTADTGPMHIASAVGTPIVAMFGPTPVARAYPIRKPSDVPARVLDGKTVSGLDKAPMETHSVEVVLHEVRELLKLNYRSDVLNQTVLG